MEYFLSFLYLNNVQVTHMKVQAWVLLLHGNVYCKARFNLWYLVPFASKKQSLNVKTIIKNLTGGQRANNIVYVQ